MENDSTTNVFLPAAPCSHKAEPGGLQNPCYGLVPALQVLPHSSSYHCYRWLILSQCLAATVRDRGLTVLGAVRTRQKDGPCFKQDSAKIKIA